MEEDRVVERLYGLVVDELRRRGHRTDQPLSVAELCDEVAPYGAVRSALELELKADYDHALLRLLAGAGDHVRLEPEEVRDELKRQLAAPLPDVAVYRGYAAARVWIDLEPGEAEAVEAPAGEPADPGVGLENAPGVEEGGADEVPGTGEEEGPGDEDVAVGGADAPETREPSDRAPIRIHRELEEDEDDGGSRVARHPGPLVPREGLDCSFCSQPLPVGRRIRFCPFCGGDQRLRPCPRCDAVLERDWLYCVRCGRPADDPE